MDQIQRSGLSIDEYMKVMHRRFGKGNKQQSGRYDKIRQQYSSSFNHPTTTSAGSHQMLSDKQLKLPELGTLYENEEDVECASPEF